MAVFFMPSYNITITNNPPSNTKTTSDAPSNLFMQSGKSTTASSSIQYGQSTIAYSSSTTQYGGLASSNQGDAPNNIKIDNT